MLLDVISFCEIFQALVLLVLADSDIERSP